MADQGANTSSSSLMRDYRKGNWTVSETMILIEAKKMDDERRMKRSTGNDNESGSSSRSTGNINKPAELRWKWVEDYCWRKGCLRSQNQCNDKWDNLMRDYKKVRDYERKVAEKSGVDEESYWKIEKNERKEKNLPTNMLPQIYEALVEVVERKSQRILGGVSSTTPTSSIGYQVVERTMSTTPPPPHHHHQHYHPPLMAASSTQALLMQHHHVSAAPPISALPLPPPVPVPATAVATVATMASVQAHQPPPPPALAYSQPILPTVDSDTSEHPNSPAKRRKKSDHLQQQTTTTTTTTSGSSSDHDQQLANAITKSASIIAEALQASEEREERRHRDMVSLHEKRLKIEESKSEFNRQGINDLVHAINNLANSIQALASSSSDHKNQSTTSSKPS